MERHVVSAITLVATSLLIAGCSQDFLTPDEDRINAAFPSKTEVAELAQKLESTLEDKAAKNAWRVEYKARQRKRVENCAKGFEPTWIDSPDNIRHKIKNPKCFSAFDDQLIRWLKWSRVHALVTAAPLRPIPSNIPSRISATKPIEVAKFATRGGIALVQSHDGLEIIDIAQDATILSDRHARAFEHRSALSPNGRVFALASGSGNSTLVSLRDSETADVLFESSELQHFQWIDDSTAWVIERGGGSAVMNLATGELIPVKGMSYPPQLLAQTSEDMFLARSVDSIAILERRQVDGKPSLAVAHDRALQRDSWSNISYSLTADGKYFVEGDAILRLDRTSKITVTSLPALTSETFDFSTFNLTRVSQLNGPELLVTVSIPGSDAPDVQAVFDVSKRTFSVVDDVLLAGASGRFPETMFIPMLGCIGVRSGAAIRFVDDVNTLPELGMEAFIQYLREQESLHEQRLADLREASMRASGLIGDLPDIAQGARIEAVGVYKSSSDDAKAPAGVVTVLVHRSPVPIMLVLSSHDPVDWSLILDPGAQLKAVLVAGPSNSTVRGAGIARRLNLGRNYAYEKGSDKYRALQRDVVTALGKPIERFQGQYESPSFVVGGK